MKSRKRQRGTDIAELSSVETEVARSLKEDTFVLELIVSEIAMQIRHHLYPMSRMVLAMRNHSDLS